MIQRLTIDNARSTPLSIGIEPWADVEIVPAKGRIDFEVENASELGVLVSDEDGEMTVGIVGDSIRLVTQTSVRRITDEHGEYAPRVETASDNETWRTIWGVAPDKG